MPILRDYRRMELAAIGPWRFASKIGTAVRRQVRYAISKVQAPRPWSSTLFCDDPQPAALAGRWLYASQADMAAPEFQAIRNGVLDRAERFLRRVFNVNGEEVRQAEPPCNGRWDIDPLSGERWPETSPFVPQGRTPGDIRFPWELDRLHHLATFGQAWRYTRNPEWPQQVVAHVEEVMGEAPYERGIHWRDGLQLAVRIFSLVAAADLCHDAPAPLHRCLNNAVLGHALALRRQMSPQSSITNNHAIGEASGLALAGLFLDRHRIARRLLMQGLRRLKIELQRQIYRDGLPYEGSLPYVRFDLEFLLLLIAALRGAGREVPAWLMVTAQSVAGALAIMADCEGRIPPMGDGDDARVLRLDDEPYLTVNETLHLAEKVLGGKGLAPTLSPDGFAIWVAGPPAAAPTPRDPKNLAVHLPDSGLIHVRRGRLDVWIDCGPTGLGPRGPGGHGHNDTTAIVVHLDGVALLHDPGWYTYYGDVSIRDRLRGTAAHNTVTVDSAEQARLGSLFEILNECKPTPTRMRTLNDGTVAIMCGHTGYERLGKQVTLRRFVVIAASDPWIVQVADVVTAARDVDVRSHLGSDLDWARDGDGRIRLGGIHDLELRGGQRDVSIAPVPCSIETGVLKTGSGIDWTVTGTEYKTAAGGRRLRYISRWRLIVHGHRETASIG